MGCRSPDDVASVVEHRGGELTRGEIGLPLRTAHVDSLRCTWRAPLRSSSRLKARGTRPGHRRGAPPRLLALPLQPARRFDVDPLILSDSDGVVASAADREVPNGDRARMSPRAPTPISVLARVPFGLRHHHLLDGLLLGDDLAVELACSANGANSSPIFDRALVARKRVAQSVLRRRTVRSRSRCNSSTALNGP